MTELSTSTCIVDRPVQEVSMLPPPRSLAQRKSKPPYLISTAIDRSFSSETETEPPPMIWPFTATKVSVAPLPSGIELPTAGTATAPAVVPDAAAAHSVTQLELSLEPYY